MSSLFFQQFSHLGSEALFPVPLGHLVERYGRIVARVPGLAELRHAQRHDLLHRVAGGLQVAAWIELFGLFRKDFADSARDGQPVVGVHVDLAHAVLNAELDFFDGYAPGGP